MRFRLLARPSNPDTMTSTTIEATASSSGNNSLVKWIYYYFFAVLKASDDYIDDETENRLGELDSELCEVEMTGRIIEDRIRDGI